MKYDAAVIGAGAAGLASARELSGAGKRVCILEARERIGGRIDTRRISGLALPIELGAEFIHGEAQSTFGAVDAAALIAYQLPDNHWWSDDGKWSLVDDFWEQIDRVRRRITDRKRDLSFAQFLRTHRDIPPRLRELACTFVEGYHAAHADRISALALRTADEEQEQESVSGNAQFRIASGYDSVMQWLLAGVSPQTDLRLGTTVHAIRWRDGDVVIEARRGHVEETIRARTAVITIPIGVWKAPRDAPGFIAFDPSLDEKERAVAQLEPGHVVKIAFRFRERFWDDDELLRARTTTQRDLQRGTPLNFVHTNDPYMPTWWTFAPVRVPVLTGWSGGHAADRLLAESPSARVDRALDAMASAFGVKRRRLESLLVATYTHDWQADPFSRCAYSYAGVGGSNAHKLLAKPVARTLFFAGEATSGDETGTVGGAIESGRRAARELQRR